MSHSMPPYPPQQPPPGGMPPSGGMPPAPPPGGMHPGMNAPYNPVDAVKYGWTAFTRNLAPFLVLAAVSLVINGSSGILSNVITSGSQLEVNGPDASVDWAGFFVAQLVGLGVSLVGAILSFIVSVAMMRGAIDVVDTGRTDLGAMFTRINWGAAVGSAILVTVLVFLGGLLCLIPGLILLFLLWFVLPAVVDGESATGAMSASYRFTTGNVADVLLFGLVCIGLVIVGVITCGIGFLAVTPVMTLGMAYTWRVLQGRPVVA